jgi:ribonuclease HII
MPAPRPSGLRLLAHDRRLGVRYVAGTDEAGRGCLAGPLVVAAVCLDLDRVNKRRLRDLDDSKRLDPGKRERLAKAILDCAAAVAVIVVSSDQIDKRGLHRSNLSGMDRALRALGSLPEVRLTDGFPLPAGSIEHRRIIGGDGRSAAIAAASVIAKTTRDRYMHGVAHRYPGYGFEQHVGYITEEHSDAVRRLGVTPLHRRSWNARAYAELALAE